MYGRYVLVYSACAVHVIKYIPDISVRVAKILLEVSLKLNALMAGFRKSARISVIIEYG